METVDLFFRFAAIGMLTLLAWILLTDRRERPVCVLGALFSLCVISYLAVSAPSLDPSLGVGRYPLIGAAVAAPVFFYLFSRAMFDDAFRFRPWHLLALIGIEAIAFVRLLAFDDESSLTGLALRIAHAVIELALVAFALALAWVERRGDLVEARRRFRLVLVAAIGAYIVVIVAVEIGLGGANAPFALGAANAGAILLVSAAITQSILTVHRGLLLPAPAQAVSSASASAAPPPEPPEAEEPRALGPRDLALIDALERAMSDDRLYREEGLAIADLAKRLGTQEHRLRRVINRELGYRNFAAFLNHYRLEHFPIIRSRSLQRRSSFDTLWARRC